METIKADILNLLSSCSPLSLEEITNDPRFADTPEARIILALEKLENKEEITQDKNNNFQINQKEEIMILGFQKYFSDKEPTNFREYIFNGVIGIIEEPIKIHSIRTGNRWKKGMSIHMAHGVRTKNYKQFNEHVEELSTCLSVQAIDMDLNLVTGSININVDGRKLAKEEVNRLIANDGLTRERFVEWFFSDCNTFTGQIIHWTDFKY